MIDSLRFVWPARARSGSQFVLSLTMKFVGYTAMIPHSRINGFRREQYRKEEKTGDFRELYLKGRGLEYIEKNRLVSMKYEEPGKDDFVLALADNNPNVVFVASHRQIEDVISSHYNIKSWGHGEADVLYQYSSCITLYEELARRRRMFLVDVDRKELFDSDAFARFLGLSGPSDDARDFVEQWQPVNDLRHQIEQSGTSFTGRNSPPRLERLRQIHRWIGEVDARYEALCQRSVER
jgi:hypothetical protein